MVRLTKEQKEFYKKNGYILLKNLVCDEELDRISEEYDELFQRKNQEKMESSWVGSDANDRKSDSAFTVSNLLHYLLLQFILWRRLSESDYKRNKIVFITLTIF